jgi:hypothetical protein
MAGPGWGTDPAFWAFESGEIRVIRGHGQTEIINEIPACGSSEPVRLFSFCYASIPLRDATITRDDKVQHLLRAPQ